MPVVTMLLREESGSAIVRLAAKILRRLFFREQWFIQIELPASTDLVPNPHDLCSLYPPADRFWADPFVVSTETGHCIFVEELPFATNKGHIAVLQVSLTGELRRSVRVIEQPYHLSYPFIFDWEGIMYMMPESGQNRTVELYRCEAFPDKWVLDRVLLPEVRAADATLLQHEGWWWLFLTQAGPGECIHEHLHVYRAASPLGPFVAHKGNPVKSGLRGTRPAGAFFHHEGRLYRPTQDCSRAYGEATIVQRIDTLSDTAFRETEVARLEGDSRLGVRRTHTLNGNERIKVLDGLRWISR